MKLTNKDLTKISAMGVCIGSLFMWTYLFGAFVLGYDYVMFFEHNIIIAITELIAVLVFISITCNIFIEEITNEQ